MAKYITLIRKIIEKQVIYRFTYLKFGRNKVYIYIIDSYNYFIHKL